MVSSKLFKSVNDGGFVDGSITRFLSDFIIPSEQHVRVYSYVFDATTKPLPASEDLVSVDLFDLVDNSIVFYAAPASTQSIVIEVATTPEEFGDVVAQGAVQAAEAARDAAIIAQDNAQASATSASNDLLATNADVVSTNAAVVATNADVVSTNADATSTAGDKANIDTRLDTVQSNTLTVEQNIEALTTGQTAIDLANAEANAAIAEVAATEAATSALSVNPSNLLHTIGTGGTDPVAYTQEEADAIMGALNSLTTIDKSSLVVAVNEVKSNISKSVIDALGINALTLGGKTNHQFTKSINSKGQSFGGTDYVTLAIPYGSVGKLTVHGGFEGDTTDKGTILLYDFFYNFLPSDSGMVLTRTFNFVSGGSLALAVSKTNNIVYVSSTNSDGAYIRIIYDYAERWSTAY